ncbi:MAG TPA: PIG-L family deacetylase [Terriglobia bacterium]|nr:PIG-L family deacetylase [Terriglobia bacterium]
MEIKRREFIGSALAGSAIGLPFASGAEKGPEGAATKEELYRAEEEVVVERAATGKPHAGKVLAAIQPHVDDVPIFAGGTVAKLINEGYTGYLIRTTNDEMAGAGTTGETVLHNEIDNDAVAKALGLKKAFSLQYRNHRLDSEPWQDFRGRLILLFRMLKVDTVICYDPWGIYEENPDHYVTAKMVEAACWMAGMEKDYPEQLAAGLAPHGVQEKYYFARGPQLVNRIVDISAHIDQKVAANVAIVTQGPGGNNGARLRQGLAAKGKRLPILGDDDDTANRQYFKHIVLDYDSKARRGVPSDRELGRKYGLEWAEPFHYIGPPESRLDQYITENQKPL